MTSYNTRFLIRSSVYFNCAECNTFSFMSLLQLEREILNNEKLGSIRLEEVLQFILQRNIPTHIHSIAKTMKHTKANRYPFSGLFWFFVVYSNLSRDKQKITFSNCRPFRTVMMSIILALKKS